MRNVTGLLALCGLLLFTGNTQAQTAEKRSFANPALRQELLKRLRQDQKIRQEWIKQGVQRLDKKLVARIAEIDAANTARIKAIVGQYGWPGPELVGRDGTEAAFLLVQHADHDTQKEMLPLVREAYQAKKLAGQFYALLLDRVLVGEGQPQVYGTQAKTFAQWKDQEPVLEPIEDEARVDQRRAEVGLPPLSEYLKMLKQMYFPKGK